MLLTVDADVLATEKARTLISCDTGLGKTVDFRPSCFIVAGGREMLDPEISPDSCWVAWQTNPKLDEINRIVEDGIFVITPIDKKTGDFLIEGDQFFPEIQPFPLSFDNIKFGNGPEWGASRYGSFVYVTAFTKNNTQLQLVRIAKDSMGSWKSWIIPESLNKAIGDVSRNLNDEVPKLLYRDVVGFFPKIKKGKGGWREDFDANPIDHPLEEIKGRMPRWIVESDGPTTKLLRTVPVDVDGRRLNQLSILNVETGEDEQISTNGRNVTFIFPWSAPELNGEAIFLATVDFPKESRLLIYRRDGWGEWKVWNTIQPVNSKYPFIHSPEPLIYNNRSYVFMVWMTERRLDNEAQSVITIASVDPNLSYSEKFHRVISVESAVLGETSLKLDPEGYLIRDGLEARIIYEDFGAINPAIK